MTIKQCLGGDGHEAPPRKVEAITTRAKGQEEEEEGVAVVERRKMQF
jgi:hypothetical protein